MDFARRKRERVYRKRCVELQGSLAGEMELLAAGQEPFEQPDATHSIVKAASVWKICSKPNTVIQVLTPPWINLRTRFHIVCALVAKGESDGCEYRMTLDAYVMSSKFGFDFDFDFEVSHTLFLLFFFFFRKNLRQRLADLVATTPT